MDAREWQAALIQRVAAWLAVNVEATPADRLEWKPQVDASSDTRTILDMVQECGSANLMAAARLRGETEDPGAAAPVRTPAEARELLQSTAAEVAAAIRALPEDALAPDNQVGSLASMPAANMVYHIGQIALMQRLYGDVENHFAR